MLTPGHRPRGFAMVEVMITVGIIGILLALGAPSYVTWTNNVQIRTASDGVLNGLQLARSESVKRNAHVRFTLTGGADGLTSWGVGCVNVTAACPATIQARNAREGSPSARLGAAPAVGAIGTPLDAGDGMPGSGVTFDAMGRVPLANVGVDAVRIDIRNPSIDAENERRLVILIAPGGAIRMCDPQLPLATNPQGCS